ncbi:hypothetical protein pdam_00001160 [Pocillopora damicornis]|uniref:Uncharacterized protein n=1 Tax=Pocillopora damicornis TaxID=46731 RepID=A0A3M6V2H3_POCDA|nr:uncharacterized protein LOC113670792 [Pocillopora damicornis]RMX59999.1 hypothetical protein pdam_00001160 [Pocillopora damicornis]
MAGKRESLERKANRDENWAAPAQQNHDDSRQTVLLLGENLHAPNKNEPRYIVESDKIKAEEVNNSDSETQFSATRTYYNTGRTGVENHQQAFQSSANQGNHGQIAHAPPTQGLGRGDQNQNYPSWPAPRGLIGVIPPRELNMRPGEDDADNSPNYRRMAVCQETDGALGQRTKMRVYMKRF